MSDGKIVVVGSSNVDLIAKVSHLPQPGETVGNASSSTAYGGKGANQAVAAARLGGKVSFVSCVGDDVHGNTLIPYFEDMGICTKYVYVEKDQPTGVAFILVADNGENCIAVAPGANNQLRGGKIEDFQSVVQEAGLLILQLEIPYETVVRLIEMAHRFGTKVLLNPAPARAMDRHILEKTDILILNETEAEIITGKSFGREKPLDIAVELHAMGPEIVILTLGASGSVIVSKDLKEYIPSHKVKTLDTTGAGDTFCGAFAARWMETGDLLDAVRFATAAAALSVMSLGAQPSIPYKADVLSSSLLILPER